MQSGLNTCFGSSSGTYGAARPCLASDNNADDDALDAMWQSMLDDIDECVQAVEVCNIQCDGGHTQVAPPTEHNFFLTP